VKVGNLDTSEATVSTEPEQTFPELTDAQWTRFHRRGIVLRLHEAGYTARDIAGMLGTATYRTVANDLEWIGVHWDERVRAWVLTDRPDEMRWEFLMANLPMDLLRKAAADSRAAKWQRTRQVSRAEIVRSVK
jgi:hypothetical protein